MDAEFRDRKDPDEQTQEQESSFMLSRRLESNKSLLQFCHLSWRKYCGCVIYLIVMIEMQENNSISDYCIDYDKWIDMYTAQILKLMSLWDSDFRIIDYL